MFEPWIAYILPAIPGLVAVVIAADVQVSHAENVSTAKLRLMYVSFGLAFVFVGAVLWYFDLGSWRLSPENRWMSRWFFMLVGLPLVLSGLLRSREGLVRDCDYFTKSADEIEIGGPPDIPAAERVRRRKDVTSSQQFNTDQ